MKRMFLVGSVILHCATLCWAAGPEGQVQRGNRLYQHGKFDESLKYYEEALKLNPESPIINYNLGTALYKNQKYADAIPFLQKGLLSDQVDLKRNTHFNLGNAYFGQAESLKNSNLNEAVSAMEESVRQYTSAMNLDDKDRDAQYNYEIVKRELELLKKQMEAQKQQKQNNQQNQQNQQKQQDQQSQNQDQETDSSQSQEQQKSNLSPEDQKKQDVNNSGEKDSPSEKKSDEDTNPNSSLKLGEMTQEEAKMMLKQFEQNEEPAGLLKMQKQIIQDRPVLKDW